MSAAVASMPPAAVAAAKEANSGEGSEAKKKSSGLMGLLRCARDLYEKSLSSCAGAGGGSRGCGHAAGLASLMPRGRSGAPFGPSNGFRQGQDDFKDLVRASSQKSAGANAAVPRTQSAPAIQRIDEEEVTDFDGDEGYPRFQSSCN